MIQFDEYFYLFSRWVEWGSWWFMFYDCRDRYIQNTTDLGWYAEDGESNQGRLRNFLGDIPNKCTCTQHFPLLDLTYDSNLPLQPLWSDGQLFS